MSRSYDKKQRNRNRELARQGLGRDREVTRDKQHRVQKEVVRSLTRVNPFPRARCTRARVVLAQVDFTEGAGSKTRPVVVICEADSHHLWVLRCTTKGQDALARGLVEITDLEACGLSRPTWVYPKPIKIKRLSIIKEEGRLSAGDEDRLFGNVASGQLLGGQRVAA